jgi:hypothetical protein
MASSGILRSVTLVRTDVSEESSASFIRVTRISELATTLAVTNKARCEEITSFEVPRNTWCFFAACVGC